MDNIYTREDIFWITIIVIRLHIGLKYPKSNNLRIVQLSFVMNNIYN